MSSISPRNDNAVLNESTFDYSCTNLTKAEVLKCNVRRTDKGRIPAWLIPRLKEQGAEEECLYFEMPKRPLSGFTVAIHTQTDRTRNNDY